MGTPALYAKFEALPDKFQQQVLDYIKFLLSRKSTKSAKQVSGEATPTSDSDPDKQLEHFKQQISTPKKPLKAGF